MPASKRIKNHPKKLRISAKTFLTITEIALLIGWKEKSLRNRISEKSLPLKPWQILFKKTDVENYMATLENGCQLSLSGAASLNQDRKTKPIANYEAEQAVLGAILIRPKSWRMFAP